ncbi:hypothetical protein [Pseudobacillus wudalianchiensis]|uniref:Fimbrial assembly protein n=1 Tax=Pseudobacillus wudalianchiensis TaxID=1743143 RepID=A0A1B9B8K8_9BACI|nr:hypothetical protein [Bacillus wudalianchiensis]OCA92402.1 hypothetical protein A8F95_01415 [Bacillus wudalianchiensis]
MLVDINLLPEKEKKRASILIPFLLLLLLIIAGAGTFLWIQTKKNEVESVDSKLKTTVQLRETLEMSQNEPKGDEEDVKKLNDAIVWAETKKLKAVPVLNHLISLLPERGFFLEYSYTANETVRLGVQFDTSRQAAYYLSELKASEWVADAKIIAVTTSVDEEEKEAKKLLEITDALPRYGVEYEVALDKAFILEKQQSEEREKRGEK